MIDEHARRMSGRALGCMMAMNDQQRRNAFLFIKGKRMAKMGCREHQTSLYGTGEIMGAYRRVKDAIERHPDPAGLFARVLATYNPETGAPRMSERKKNQYTKKKKNGS